MKEVEKLMKTGYEGGTAVAPRLTRGTVGLPGGSSFEEMPPVVQSVHAASTKIVAEEFKHSVPESSSMDEQLGSLALEPTAEAFVSGKKKDARVCLEGLSLSAGGSRIVQGLLEVLPLRSQTTGKGEKLALFPLPTSRSFLLAHFPELSLVEVDWLICVCLSLNSTWGGMIENEKEINKVQEVCLNGLIKDVKRFCSLDTRIEELDWRDFFNTRSVDYKGDEVKVARKFSWSNIAPALPREVGKVPLVALCTLGSKYYVEHFDSFLKPVSQWGECRRPRVMVDDHHWGEVCTGLVDSGVCTFIEESEVFHVHGEPLLNGLFGVTKDEWTDSGVEIFRLIMNLVPLNSLCMPMTGDVETLPSWGGMSPFFLQPTQNLVITSEDVKCFFYTMSVPPAWVKYFAFNKPVPEHVLPRHLRGNRVYLASLVLPMGFLNSVSLAQHVHRNLVMASGGGTPGVNAPEAELRKDRAFTSSDTPWRVYLDNYDLLEKVEATGMSQVEGSCAPGVLALRQEYERWGVPRNEKKAVQRSARAELQGAIVDGVKGVAYPKESKLVKYLGMAWRLAHEPGGTQKQWQVTCGGLVYFSMFRRPLLGLLNAVWRHIESFSGSPTPWLATPDDCRLELLRFVGSLPLARLDFRLDMHPTISCSDASNSGGGLCASHALTAFGAHVADGGLRGEQLESSSELSVLSIGLFDGLAAFRVCHDVLGVRVLGHISVEKSDGARRVVETHYPGVVTLEDVADVTPVVVKEWSAKFSQCSLVIIGAGPPCQGVSGLNADRKGALKDERSSLFCHVPRIRDLVRQHFRWCPVYTFMESVASMDACDRQTMSEAFGVEPYACNAGTMTWCQRPRLYWIDWEVQAGDGVELLPSSGVSPAQAVLTAHQPIEDVVRRGWIKVNPDQAFPTFTTSRPQKKPGRKPAGILQCSEADVSRWQDDLHRFPPYQYREMHCLVNKKNSLRVPDINEREVMLGFPLHYTVGCAPKGQRKSASYHDLRLSLLGNTWSVPVVAWFLSQLYRRLGLCGHLSPQDIVDRLRPGGEELMQGRLVRLPLNPAPGVSDAPMYDLAFKLGNLISMKGEDLMLTTPTTQQARHHRLRATIPSKLWKWRVVAGWQWHNKREHINALELRAVLTSLRWRVEHRHHVNTRFIHLTDSLVCLHCLSRGRSSSRKLRRTLSRVNALVLASNSQPLWGYIHTDQNPADKPSRWGRRVRTKFKHGA